MNSPYSDLPPPGPEKLDIVVRGQALTAEVVSIPDDTRVSFSFLRSGVPETRFTRHEAKALIKAMREILNAHPNYGSRNPIY